MLEVSGKRETNQWLMSYVQNRRVHELWRGMAGERRIWSPRGVRAAGALAIADHRAPLVFITHDLDRATVEEVGRR